MSVVILQIEFSQVTVDPDQILHYAPSDPCADPGIYRGWGGPGPTARKQSGQVFFLFYSSSTYFTVYRGGRMVLLQRKLYFSKDPEGVQHFPGGGGGSKC